MNSVLSRLMSIKANGFLSLRKTGTTVPSPCIRMWTSGSRVSLTGNIWTQVAGGAVTLNGMSLNAGDGAAVTEEEVLEIRALEGAELLLFDLAWSAGAPLATS